MDNKSPKDRNLFHKNMNDVVRYRLLYDGKTSDDLHAESVERRLAKMQEKKDKEEYDKKQAELNKDREPALGEFIFKFAVIFFAFIGLILIISAIAKGAQEENNHTTYPSTYKYRTTIATTTYRTTTAAQTTTKLTTYKKSSSRKKTTTKKDKYNVYDYKDPEDFYEDNYDDFWDYEDAEDYYREKTKQ